MRIGLISGEYPPMHGGVGDYTRELALAMRDAGHHVAVLTDRRARSDRDSGSPIQIDPIIGRWNWASLLKIRRWVQQQALDLINIQYETAAYGMSAAIHILPRLVSVPTVTTFHDLRVPYLFPKAGRLRNQALWLLARQSAGVIATDSADSAQLRLITVSKAVAQIPIGSNIPTLPPAGYDHAHWRVAHNFRPETVLIGYFGFMNAEKGLEALIDGLAQALHSGLDSRLVLIGGGATESDPNAAAYMDTIRARIYSAGLSDRVMWTGYLSAGEVSAWLLSCDLIALPFTDGVSLRRGSFLAALAHGCAILTTPPQFDISGIETATAFVPVNDPTALAQQFAMLGSDPARRKTLGEQAQEFARQFSWPAIATRTVAFYEQCLAGKSAMKSAWGTKL